MKFFTLIINTIKKLFTRKKSKNFKQKEIDKIVTEVIKMNDKDKNSINPVELLFDKTQQRQIKWNYLEETQKKKFYNLLVNKKYKSSDMNKFSFHEIFELKSDKVNIYVSQITASFNYTHITICDKTLDCIIIDYDDNNYNSIHSKLFRLVKDQVTEEIISSIK
jgi:hypothetical protein